MIKVHPAINQEVPTQDTLQVTDAAYRHLLRRLQKTPASIGIVISVKKAGCSGFKYVVDAVQSLPEQAFEFCYQDTLKLFIPHQSFPFLKGCTVEYVKQGINAQLRIINPNETGSCGCGESFSVGGVDPN